MDIIMESVPNYSEGRDMRIVEKIADCFRNRVNVKLLNYSADKDHNRCVITAVGEPNALGAAVIDSVGVALENIDLTRHKGQHPRMGAVDVIPFIPIRGCTLESADKLARHVAEQIAVCFGQPSILYEKSASSPARENLSDVRRGEFEGMADKMKDPVWQPDYGPNTIHPTGGVTAIGARMPLIAFNVNLSTPDVNIAKAIAKAVRHSSGGLKYVKAMGVMLEERNQAQVSMNLTDFTQSSIFRVFDMVKREAARFGVIVVGSELIGLAPLKALVDCAEYYLQIEDFNYGQVLETQI